MTRVTAYRRDHFLWFVRQAGKTIEDVRPCVLADDAETITVDRRHPAFPRSRPVEPPGPQRPRSGPGTELKALLAKVGIHASPGCSCNARAAQMDALGPDECGRRIDEIVGWLREEARKRGLPFVDAAGRLLVMRAIRNARQAAAS